MSTHIIPNFDLMDATGAVSIAFVFIAAMSLVKEPIRQKLNAIIIAGAGAAYLSGGFGVWEFPFCALITFVAYKGLGNYKFIALGWLLHSAWDLLHHLYGNPIVPFSPTSSAGCCICDAILALWFAFNAPSIFNLAALKQAVKPFTHV